ncbi:MAG: betaine/proline/choline family ABC transporter ATP-binding protein [Proteobacteria bacterium]|nr:betaine/proline/choline family ABC transporter ATP-binding protein [Pseudomonadota bacterium]
MNQPTAVRAETDSAIEISCRGVWKVFGQHPHRVIDTLNERQSRQATLRSTGHVIAVRDASFEVRKGETFVVMGLSGSGKSTLVRCMCRLTEPTRGAIVIGDRDIVTLDEAELRQLRRRRMSMVFQHFGLFAHRRVIDNVAYGLEVQGMARRSRLARAQDMIELVGLSGWEQHYPNQLSGGMQQRVGLARALTVDPDILLFDEPFSALDPLIRRELRSELVKLQQTMHKTIVFITHDFAEALELGERIAIMRDGQFVQIGSPEQLITAPADDYVSAFTRDVSRLTVLTVSSIMRDCEQVGQAVSSDESGTVLPAGTRLADALPALVERETPVLVANHDNNVVGCVDRAALVEALVANTSARSPNGRAESPAT